MSSSPDKKEEPTKEEEEEEAVSLADAGTLFPAVPTGGGGGVPL